MELGRALRGPRRVKADLLAEARDGLRDAAQAYVDSGMPAGRAAEGAVADFGEVGAVAAGFQAELSLAQARRTAVWVAVVVAIQPLVWGREAEPMTPVMAVLDRYIEGVGFVAIIGALLAWVAGRYLGTGIAPITGVFVLTVAALLIVMSAAMVWASGDRFYVPWALVFLGLPMAGIALSARSCFAH